MQVSIWKFPQILIHIFHSTVGNVLNKTSGTANSAAACCNWFTYVWVPKWRSSEKCSVEGKTCKDLKLINSQTMPGIVKSIFLKKDFPEECLKLPSESLEGVLSNCEVNLWL